MLLQHPFKEASLATFGKPQSLRTTRLDLADMEGAFFWESASRFLQLSSIVCLKVVLDDFNPEMASPKIAERLMVEAAPPILGWLNQAHVLLKPEDSECLSKDEQKALKAASSALSLTFAMALHLEDICRKSKIRGFDVLSQLKAFGMLRPSSKSEGKALYGKLCKGLLLE
jgi:hypothetical protein